MEHLISFGSDNHSGIHPEILKAMVETNQGHAPSYGTDAWTEKTNVLIKLIFGENSQPFFVFNGTAANVLALKALVQSYEAVICSDMAHLHLDECGAPEAIIGCKLLTLPTHNGKITAQQIEESIIRRGDQHFAQPRAISITQPTEVGTVYSLEEIKEIREVARRHQMYLHIDGARLIYAANYLDCDLETIVEGADVVSFGGTKNGLLGVELVLFMNPSLAKNFNYIRKQGLQLPSKMRFLSAQFYRFLSPDLGEIPLWKEVANHGHRLAQKLAAGIREIPEMQITQEVQANSVFARIPKAWLKPLREKFFFYVWDEKTWEVRLMISYDLTEQDVNDFLAHIHSVRGNQG